LSQSTPPELVTVPDKVYDRPLWKTVTRAFGAIVLCILNVAMVGSIISRVQAHLRINWQLEAVTLLVIIFMDAAILRQVVFEVRKVSLWKDRIALNTLFWKATLSWDQIIEFKKPGIVAMAVIKTKKVAYRLNKKDFSQFADLMEKLEAKLGEQTKSA
jgi:hypothetical protein